VLVTDRVHPLYGRQLTVLAPTVVKGVRCLIVRLPDGSPAAVPLSATSASPAREPAGEAVALLSAAGVRRLRALLQARGADRTGT